MSKLVLKQDLFQPKYQFDMEIKFSQRIIQLFPTLSNNTVLVVTKSIINKLCEGVEYPKNLESTIKKIYPKLLESFQKEETK